MIATSTIGLCFLTQTVAGWLGISLPEQQNVELVRMCLRNAFVSGGHFLAAAFLVLQVIILMPVIEEFVFRWLLVMLPIRWRNKRTGGTFDYSDIRLFGYSVIVISSALFSSAHYLQQPFPDNAFLALFLFGIEQCWLYLKTNRIWCAMLSHALFNLTNILLLFVF